MKVALNLCSRPFISFLLFWCCFTIEASEEVLLAEVEKVSPHQPREFQFFVKDAENRHIRLSLDVRFDYHTLGGYTNGMSLTLNGQKITGKRLLNKLLKCRLRNGSVLKWADEDGSSFNIMYAGDFSDQILTNTHYIYGIIEEGQDPFRFVFDLTGLTIHNNANKLVISTGHSVGLVVANVKVIYDEKESPRVNDTAAQVKPAPQGILPDFRYRPPILDKPVVKEVKDGVISFECEGQVYSVGGRFSLPDGEWCQGGGLTGLWRESANPQGAILETPRYRLIRKAEVNEGYLKITDKFENLTDSVVGIMFENTLDLPKDAARIFRGGRETDLSEISSGSNPSIIAELKDESVVAIVVEDDIFRNQHYLKKGKRFLVAGNRRLGLPPRSSHTLEWSVFCIGKGTYYDCINAIRRAWKINFTMEGPLAFPRSEKITDWNVRNVTPEFIREYLRSNPVKLVMTHVPTSPSISRSRSTIEKPWIGHGTAAPQFDWWCGRTAALVRVMQQVAPEVEVYAYLHKNLCSEPGYPEKYRDSMAISSAGTERHSGKLGLFLPTPNNSYGKALAEVYKFIVQEFGANIYLDEICLSVTQAAPYAEWDGCTVEIDRGSHEIIRKLSLPNLLVKPWLEEMIEYLNQNEKKVLANGPPVTRTLQQHNIQHFVEAGMGETGLIAAHLATPLAWQGYIVGLPAYKHFKQSLNHGALTITWSGVWSNHLFPFTPLELRPGYVIGEERIVTRLSGRFGWGEKVVAECKMYDGNGVLVEKPTIEALGSGSETVFEVRMPSDHAAVIIRKSTL